MNNEQWVQEFIEKHGISGVIKIPPESIPQDSYYITSPEQAHDAPLPNIIDVKTGINISEALMKMLGNASALDYLTGQDDE